MGIVLEDDPIPTPRFALPSFWRDSRGRDGTEPSLRIQTRCPRM
jgi:hypothetical protein